MDGQGTVGEQEGAALWGENSLDVHVSGAGRHCGEGESVACLMERERRGGHTGRVAIFPALALALRCLTMALGRSRKE